MDSEIEAIAAKLVEEFGIGLAPARAVARMIEGRLREEQERFNAWLLSRVMMRLAEADCKKTVAVSMAFAAGVPDVWVRRERLRCAGDRDVNAAARVLGVPPAKFRGEIARSRDFLGIEEEGLLAGVAGAEAFRKAAANQHWRN